MKYSRSGRAGPQKCWSSYHEARLARKKDPAKSAEINVIKYKIKRFQLLAEKSRAKLRRRQSVQRKILFFHALSSH